MNNKDLSNNRWELLAAARFVLASIVVVNHLQEYVPIGWMRYFGMLGSFEAILGFLFISGYSIGSSLKKDPHNFYKRRAMRLYPVYIVSIVFTYFVMRDTISFSFIGIILINLLFLNQLITSFSYVGPAWSLSLEVWYYIVAPYLLKLKSNIHWILIWISFGLFVFYTCGRTVFDWSYYSNTLFGINFFILGFIWIAGFTYSINPGEKNKTFIKVTFILLVYMALTVAIQFVYRQKHDAVILFVKDDLLEYIFQSGMLLILLVLFYTMERLFYLPSEVKKTLHFLGNISYPLYLIHIPCFILFKEYTSNWALLLLLSLILSTIIYWSVDFYSKKRNV